jgi:hypothetical protein
VLKILAFETAHPPFWEGSGVWVVVVVGVKLISGIAYSNQKLFKLFKLDLFKMAK